MDYLGLKDSRSCSGSQSPHLRALALSPLIHSMNPLIGSIFRCLGSCGEGEEGEEEEGRREAEHFWGLGEGKSRWSRQGWMINDHLIDEWKARYL